MIKLTCPICGKPFERKPSKIGKFNACSRECSNEYRKTFDSVPKKQNEIIEKENYYIIKIQDKDDVYDCLIDKDDIQKIQNHYWTVRKDKRHPNCTPYVQSCKKGKRVHLHRLITNCPNDKVVDHINGNGFDNRKCNLRVVSQSINAVNKHHKKNIGIKYVPRNDYWVAYIRINGKLKNLGYYRTQEDAIPRREFVNNLIRENKFDEIMDLECERLPLPRNNKTGFIGICKLKNNTFQIHYKAKYLGTVKTLEEAIKLREDYIKTLS